MIRLIYMLTLVLGILLARCGRGPEKVSQESGCSPASKGLFEKAYAPFRLDPGRMYGLKDKNKLQAFEASESNCNDLMFELSYEFESMTDSTQYYISNIITLFREHTDAVKGWTIGTEAFWKAALEKIDSSEIAIFRDSRKYRLGDLSEYSEIPVGEGFVMSVMHIRLDDLFLKYAAIVPVDKKELFVSLVKEKTDRIQKVHFKIR